MKNVLFYKTIDEKNVLDLAIKLVKSAKSNIIVTQSDSEKTKVVPNDQYFKTLNKKIKEGIEIERYFFGKEETYLSEKNRNFQITYLYAGHSKYFQRMILVDEKRAMFKIKDSFCYTEFEPLIHALQSYCLERQKEGIHV